VPHFALNRIIVEDRPPRNPEREAAPDDAGARRRSRRSRRSSAARQEQTAAIAEIAATILFAASVIGSVLAIGTVHTTTLLVVAAAVFGAAALLAYARSADTSSSGQLTLSVPVITFGALAAYTLLQAMPLPIGVLRVIAPANADVWERALLPFGEPPRSWASLSLDPGASAIEALKWAVYGVVFATAAAISARRGAAFGIAIVFGSAALAALTTVGHGLASMTKVFGLYQPEIVLSPWHVGPLINPNNLAGYLNLGALAGLGLMLMHRPILPAWLVGLGVMLIVGVDITSASRAGVLTLPLGVLALALIARLRGGSSDRAQRASPWLLGLAVGGGALMALLGATRETWTELYQKDLSKIGMIVWARPLLGDHPWFGVGRGAFESVFPFYRTSPGNLVYTHAENFPAQWASEWGIPVTIAAIAAFAWSCSPGRLGALRSAAAAGGWVSVVVLLAQNMFDLALEVPAVCIAAAVVLGSMWGDGNRRRLPREAKAKAPAPARWRWIVGGLAASGALLIALAGQSRRTDVSAERSAIRASFERRNLRFPEEARALRGELRAAMLRHPAEPYFPLIGALAAVRARDQNPMPWLQHTLERGQVNGKAHLLLAEVLHARGAKKQAFFEVRLAVENDHGLSGSAGIVIARWSKKYDEILTSVPEGKAGVRMLDEIAARFEAPEDWEIRALLDREVIARDPGEVSARVREVEVRLQILGAPPSAPHPAAGLCPDREACRREVLDQATAIASIQPLISTAALIRSRLLLADGKPEEAARLLEAECEKVTDRLLCLQARVRAASQIKDPERLNAAAKELIAYACATPSTCAEMATWIGDLRTGRGEMNLALGMYERAARVDPTEARWLRLAESATRVGAHAVAAEALEKVAQRKGHDPELKKRIEDEKRRSLLPP